MKAKTSWGRRLQRFLSTAGVRFFEPKEVTSLLEHAGFEPDLVRIHGAVFFVGATRR